jgi:hypothetical protein
MALLATAAMMPLASAHPVDAFNFFPTGTPPMFGVGPGFPALFVGPTNVAKVTLNTLLFPFTGAGSCAPSNGIGCFTPPAFNPNTGAAPAIMDCQITSTNGPWPGMPGIYLIQDLDENGVLDNTGLGFDPVVGPIGLAYGSPFGFLPAVGFGAGATGGVAFTGAGGPFVPGVPVHVVAEHSFAPLQPDSALVSLSVTCLVL